MGVSSAGSVTLMALPTLLQNIQPPTVFSPPE